MNAPAPAPPNWLSLMSATWADITRTYPAMRRFQAQGFDLDPRRHRSRALAVISPNQALLVDPATGDIVADNDSLAFG